MKEYISQQTRQQAEAFQKRHEPLFSADANDPLRKIISLGMVEEVSHWTNEVLNDEPMTFTQEGKEYIVFENLLGETRIVGV